jgi:putative tryptophan/tyrosine transport system substrate-binding protein
MKRRELITLLGAAATSSMLWPLAARPQQPAMPLIGLLFRGSCEQMEELMAAFRKGLSETGYVEGRNVTFELRRARNEQDRLPELVADLVRRQVSVIASPGSDVAALAAKAATTSIPIVFSTARDPVQIGLVASLNRPGGNVTGVSYMNAEIGVKRLGLLHELLPAAKRFAALLNRDDPVAGRSLLDLEAAAAALGLRQLLVLSASSEREIDAVFASLAVFASFPQRQVSALLVSADALFVSRREKLVALAARHSIPAIYDLREFAAAGGLMSYGSTPTDAYRQVGVYTGRILRGEMPADLPVQKAVKVEFVINLKTAKALGLTIPPGVLAIADEVIE